MDLPATALLAAAIVAAGAFVQGSVGFGMALVAAPLLVLIDPAYVPAPVILAALSLTLMIAARERTTIDVRGVGWALGGRVFGTALGVLAMLALPADAMSLTFAGLVLLAVALTASGLRVSPRPSTLIGAGLASGVMGTISSIGGPPVALVYQHADGPRLRGTLAGYFIFSTLMSLTGLALAGLLGERELLLGAGLVPGAILGFALSSFSRHALDAGYTRHGVLALSALAAVGVIAQQC